MKAINFRLSETQATLAAIIGFFSLIFLACLCVVVLKNFNTETWTILYSETSALGRYRKMLTFILTAFCIVAGLAAVAIGFSTLGQKRNTKQGRSFLGMATGAIAVALSPVLLILWMNRAEAVIQQIPQ